MKKHKGTRLIGCLKINKRVTSIFLILTLLFSCFSQFSLGYANEKYEGHVDFRDEEKIKKEIKVGETIDIYAMVVDEEGNEITDYDSFEGDVARYTEYKWSSKEESIAQVEPDNEYFQELGHIKGVSAGTVKITVKSTSCDNCESKEIELKVIEDKPKYEGYVDFRDEEKINKEIKVGETIDIYAMVVDEEGNEITDYDSFEGDVARYTEYKWSSKEESIAQVKPDNEYFQELGHIKGVSEGTVKIKVESTDCDNCEPKEIEITVIDDKPKYEKHVDFRHKEQIKKEIKVGETITIYAMVVDDEGTEDKTIDDTQYKWSSKGENIATVIPDDFGEDIGNITGMSSGTVKITVENTGCKNCEPKEIEITVIDDKSTVEKGEIDNINISLNKDIKELEVSKKIKLNVIAKDSTGKELENPDIKWEIEPKDSAVIDNNILSVLKEGNITIKAVVEKSDKTIVESNSVSIKVIKSISREEKIEGAIDSLIVRYKNPTLYGPEGLSSKYTDKLALALRHSGMDIEGINKTKKIFSTQLGYYSMLNTSRNIMTLIAVNEDPKKEVEKIIDSSFVFYEDEDAEKLVNAIIALDMSGVDYNKEAAVKALINKTVKNGDNVYFESYEVADVELTAKSLIPFSKHRDIDGVTDTINGIKKYLKSIQSESGLIKDITYYSSEESCSVTSEVIQGIIALEENPLDEYWIIEDEYGNKNNLVDAMLNCRDGQRFKNSPTGSCANIQTDAAMAALTDLKNKKSMYNEIKYIKAGEPSRIKINNEAPISIVEGDTIEIKASVYDKDNNQIKNPNIIWESLDKSKVIIENGVVTALNEGNINIKVSLKDKPEISDQININIKWGISDDILKEKVKKEIEFLKEHYEAYNQYEFLSSPAGINSGIDKDKVQNRIHKRAKYTDAYQYAKLIISSLGADLDPRCIEFKGEIKNSVDILRASQVKDGEHKGQFRIDKSYSDSIESLAYCIIALDMADADYDKESAVNALINLLSDPDIKTKLGQDEVMKKAVALTAFANHKKINGVNEQIESIIKILKEKQNEDGGFDSKMGKNNPVAIATVVQGLMANDINPLYSKEWMKNKKTMLDSILKSKYEHPTDISRSGYSSFEGGSQNFKSTYYAFAALTDMYQNESMFKKFTIKYDGKVDLGEINKISILKSESNKMLIGETLKLYVNTFDNKYNLIENSNVIWEASDNDIASVDENGVVTAKKSGKVTITASNKNIKDTIDINIQNIGVNSIKIEFNKNKIRVCDEINLKAKAYDGTDSEVKDQRFVWSSSNENIARVDSITGKVTPLSKGKIVLKAVLKDNQNIKDEITLDIIDKKSVKVNVRVEGSKNNVIPETELEVDNFGLGVYGNGDCILKEYPTAMNALIAALQKNNIDCKDKEKFDAGDKLIKITNINGLKEFGAGPNSGWMYYVNNSYVEDYLINTQINDGDDICVYYVEDYKNVIYSYFDKNEIIVNPNEDFNLQLKGRSNSGGDINIQNAKILVNDKEQKIENKNLLTNEDGKVTLKFEKEGEYIISASRSSEGNIDISRPYCKVKVTNEISLDDVFEVKTLDSNKFSNGEEARLKISLKNKLNKLSDVICRVELCDENNKVLKYSCVEKVLEANEERVTSPGFAIPDSGKYKIKIFVSNSKNNKELFKTININ